MSAESRQPLWAALAVACLVIAALFAAFVELAIDPCAPLAAYAKYGLFSSLFVTPMLLAGRRRWTVFVLGAFILSLLLLHFVDWSTRKPFLRDFRRVEVGMTMGEVETIMGGYMKGTGWRFPRGPAPKVTGPGQPEPDMSVYGDPDDWPEFELEDAITYRHSELGAYNSDWGVVRFKDGMVVATEFLRD